MAKRVSLDAFGTPSSPYTCEDADQEENIIDIPEEQSSSTSGYTPPDSSPPDEPETAEFGHIFAHDTRHRLSQQGVFDEDEEAFDDADSPEVESRFRPSTPYERHHNTLSTIAEMSMSQGPESSTLSPFATREQTRSRSRDVSTTTCTLLTPPAQLVSCQRSIRPSSPPSPKLASQHKSVPPGSSAGSTTLSHLKQIQDLQLELQASTAVISDLDSSKTDLAEHAWSLQVDLDEVRDRLIASDKVLSLEQSKLQAASIAIETLTEQLLAAEANDRHAQHRMAQLDEAVSEMTNQLDATTNDFVLSLDERDSALWGAKQETLQQVVLLQARQAELKATRSALETRSSEVEALSHELVVARGMEKFHASVLSNLTARCDEVESHVKGLETDLAGVTDRKARLEVEVGKMRGEAVQREKEISKLRDISLAKAFEVDELVVKMRVGDLVDSQAREALETELQEVSAARLQADGVDEAISAGQRRDHRFSRDAGGRTGRSHAKSTSQDRPSVRYQCCAGGCHRCSGRGD